MAGKPAYMSSCTTLVRIDWTQAIESVVCMVETASNEGLEFCEWDAERLESSAKIIRERLQNRKKT